MSVCVLIVDDSLTVRMNLADAFETAGFRTLSCADAASARGLLAVENVDVLVLDVVLPDGNGMDLLRELRETPGSQELPVIMLSSEADVADRLRGMRTGADEYVGKPYDVHYVVTKARELAAANRAVRESLATGAVTVLVIDDSATFRLHLSETLSEAGYRVVTAVSGEEGLRLAAAQRPNAMIVDGVLPGIDGATVVRRVRLDAALRSVPCILLTATEDPEAELRALDSGADAFVRKDHDLDLMLARLSALLRISRGLAEPDPNATPLTCKKILAVDGSPTYREHLARLLESEGYDVAVASSGEEAIELLAVQPVDCILLALILEGMDGTETCRRIKSSPGLRDVPVIILSGAEDRAALLSGLHIGADDCIPKSAELEVFKARVQAQLRRRQFEEETRRGREQLMRGELEAAAANSARQLAETRAVLVSELERKNQELQAAYAELQATQGQLVQSAKMASLGELVAGVAHEINNPLAFVLSHLDTVKRSLNKVHPDAAELPEASREPWRRAHNRLQEMSLGLERIRELVLKLRTFSRLDEGEYKRVSMRECIEALLTILAHRLKDRIELQTDYGEPDQLDCYPGLLTQAIMNLVANSIDAISGPGKIFISTGRVGDLYRITVRDTGHGIPQHLRERVLEPFFTTKPVGEGTGLGLSITYSIVRKHQGTLLLGEAPSGGTQAIIELPLGTTPERESVRAGSDQTSSAAGR